MDIENDDALEGAFEDTTAADLVAEGQDTDQPGDDPAATADAGEGEGEQPKPKRQTAEERIAEVTRARREAEREAAHWRRIAQEGKPAAQDPPATVTADAEPDPADFTYGETDPGYIKALGSFTARQEFARLTREQEARTRVNTVESTWTERQQSFAKDKPDYQDKIDGDWACTKPMADAIKTSEDGPAVAYHLASNPAEARRIAALDPLAQIRAIGRIEASLTKADPTPQPKTVSDAPPPHPQVRGSAGRFTVAPDTDDLNAFEKVFHASR